MYRKQSWAHFFPRGSKVAFKTQKSQIFDVFFDLRSIIYRTVAYLLNLFFIGIGTTTYFGPINRVFVFGKPYDPKFLTDFTLKISIFHHSILLFKIMVDKKELKIISFPHLSNTDDFTFTIFLSGWKVRGFQ